MVYGFEGVTFPTVQKHTVLIESNNTKAKTYESSLPNGEMMTSVLSPCM